MSGPFVSIHILIIEVQPTQNDEAKKLIQAKINEKRESKQNVTHIGIPHVLAPVL